MLNDYLDQDEEICIAWWGKELFEDSPRDNRIKLDVWNRVVSEFDDMTEYYQGLIYNMIVETITEYEGWIDNE